MRSTAKILGKTLTSIRMKASRLGLVVVDEGEKNTLSTTTLAKLVLPIEYYRRRSSAQLCVWDGATLALKKNREWTWAPNINGASYVSSVAIEDVDVNSQTEIVTGVCRGTSWELAHFSCLERCNISFEEHDRLVR